MGMGNPGSDVNEAPTSGTTVKGLPRERLPTCIAGPIRTRRCRAGLREGWSEMVDGREDLGLEVSVASDVGDAMILADV